MIGVRRLVATVAIAATVTAGALVTGGPAAGATPAERSSGRPHQAGVASAGPAITFFNCEQGVRNVVCEVVYAGGTAPVTTRWYWSVWPATPTYMPWWDNLDTVVAACQPPQYVWIQVVVTDANGLSDGRGRTTRCVNVIP